MAILNNSNAISPSGYDVNNSLRFRSSASAYLNRTPGSASNRKTWTWSAWVKRGQLGAFQTLFCAGPSDAVSPFETRLRFNDTDTLVLTINGNGASGGSATTTAVFRDPSAWYHIVAYVDMAASGQANKVRLYVNGVLQAVTYTILTTTDDTQVNNNVIHRINANSFALSGFADNYLAEVNFIDGQALTPSSFGETDTTTGVWKPKAYTGTYGTNGFYLKFSDIATTSGSNAGLGKDFSGNTNYWTTNNISVTSGTTYDAMKDSPTNTSATVGNYCTWNPLVSSSATYSNGNLRFVGTANEVWISPTIGVSSGKFYWETTVEAISSTILHIGITQLNGAVLESGLIARSYYGDGTKYSFQSGTVTGSSFGSSYAVNDIIQVALDMDSGKVWFGKNNTWQASGNPSAGTNEAYSGLTGTFGPFSGKGAVGNQPTVVLNCGQRPFAYTPPTGFVRLNTYNLPDSTIKKGNTVMDATLYTGNGGTQTITNAGGFRPDFVWLKRRNTSGNNGLYNSVTGVGNFLVANATDAENSGGGVSSFNSNGWSFGNLFFNDNGDSFVGWQWQAGQGSTSSNTSGSITSTVSVNTTAGFSVVTYTGTGSAATIGHGLGVAPRMIITKQRNATRSWGVYHASLGAGNAVYLDLTNASAVTTNWNSTTPTSSVFSVGNANESNASGGTYVGYCWAEIAGFSKFGSYTGNGSTDGPFVFTGFMPKYVMIKQTNTTGDWQIFDTSRSPTNVASNTLYANGSFAEDSNVTNRSVDFLSNGFKIRSSGTFINASGGTFIFMAFAENPTKYALAR